MGRPNRSEQFSPDEVCIVHTVQRCVRRAFLAGLDELTGKDFSYRREWLRLRLESLASVFGMDVLTYAVMSNHIHTVLRNRPDIVAGWTDREVAVRWLSVFPGQRLEELYLAQPTDVQVQTLVSDADKLAVIRRRLSDISWFMRALAEPIARSANREDECTGHFWEGRFKAQRITDEAGLLACAMYVDLNPVRAAMAETLEQSLHTSAYDRLLAEQGLEIDSAAFELEPIAQEEAAKLHKEKTVEQLRELRKKKHRNPVNRRVLRDSWLAPLTMDSQTLAQDPQPHRGGVRASDKGFLSLKWQEYVALLRWTAKQRFDQSEGPSANQSFSQAAEKVPKSLGQVLSRLGIDASMWRDLVWNFKKYFGNSSCAGSPESMSADAERNGKRWHRGQARVRVCFAAAQTGGNA
jgi:REP element-mobilizing transposase RayT